MANIYLDINGDILNDILGLERENRIDKILEEMVDASPTNKKKKPSTKIKEDKKEKKNSTKKKSSKKGKEEAIKRTVLHLRKKPK